MNTGQDQMAQMEADAEKALRNWVPEEHGKSQEFKEELTRLFNLSKQLNGLEGEELDAKLDEVIEGLRTLGIEVPTKAQLDNQFAEATK